MTAAEKSVFITDLIRSTEKTVLEAVSAMPDNWDGIELREYIADKFADSTSNYLHTRFWHPTQRKEFRKRSKDYENEIITNRLL